MIHRTGGHKLGRATSHRMSMYRNLVTDLLGYEKITTTEVKAKQIRGIAEKMITLGKDGGLPSRRRALAFVMRKEVVAKLFGELGPRYSERHGGYTRMVKLGPRLGDGADMVQIELVK